MSIFYTTIDHLVLPLLLFGILLALLQFSFIQINNQRQGGLRRFLSVISESSQWPLFILVLLLGGYILFKLGMTVSAWVANFLNITFSVWGQQIPSSIDCRVVIGASILLVALLIILITAIRKHIQHRRGKKITWL